MGPIYRWTEFQPVINIFLNKKEEKNSPLLSVIEEPIKSVFSIKQRLLLLV